MPPLTPTERALLVCWCNHQILRLAEGPRTYFDTRALAHDMQAIALVLLGESELTLEEAVQ